MPNAHAQSPSKPTRGFLTAIGKLCLPIVQCLWGNLSTRWVRRWAKVFYVITWPFTAHTRKIVRSNLAIAFPDLNDKQINGLIPNNIQYIFELGLDWLHFLTYPTDINKRLIIPPEIDAFRKTRASDTSLPPALFCTLHLGNWELASHVSYLTGRKGAVVTARFTVEWFNELTAKMRTTETDTVLIPSQGAARGMLQSLKEGYDLGILIDQHVSPKRGGVFLNFFGLTVTTSLLPATIAIRHRMPVYLVACYKRPDGNFGIEMGQLPKSTVQYSSASELTQDILHGYEKLIRRHPEQYLWLYRYWRVCPANAPQDYFQRYPFYARQYSTLGAEESLFSSSVPVSTH